MNTSPPNVWKAPDYSTPLNASPFKTILKKYGHGRNSIKRSYTLSYSSSIPTINIKAETDARMTIFLEKSYDSCMPKGTYGWVKKSAYWWSQDVAEIRKACLAARRLYKISRHCGALNLGEVERSV